jgi:hypothetical protein
MKSRLARIAPTLIACTLVAGSAALAPPVLGSAPSNPTPTDPIRGSDFYGTVLGPDVSLLQAWKIRARFPSADRLREAVFQRTGQNPRIVKREVYVGLWSGEVCDGYRSGSQTWKFSSNAGRTFEANKNWGADGEVTIELFRGARNQARAFQPGDAICVYQTVTWSPSGSQDNTRVSYGTQSAPGLGQGPLPLFLTNEAPYQDAIPAPAVSPFGARPNFNVSFAPLTTLRRQLESAGYQAELKGMEIRVGTYTNGQCQDHPRRVGSSGIYRLSPGLTEFEQTRNWSSRGSRRGTVTMLLDRPLAFAPGDTACIYQIVSWTAPEVNGQTIRYASTVGITPNGAPGSMEIRPNIDPTDIDPDLLDGPEIVLPDFEIEDAEGLDLDFDPGSISATDLRRAAERLVVQMEAILDFLGANQRNNPGAQRDAIIEAANNPQRTSGLIDVARRDFATLRAAADQSGAPEDFVQRVGLWEEQLNDIAGSVPVSVAGGIVPARELAQALGFDPAQAPIAGTNGSGRLTGLSFKVVAPKTATRGKAVTIRATASPRSTGSTAKFALVRKAGGRLQVVGSQKATVRGGKATVRLTIPRATRSGSYTLIASLVPKDRKGSGVTVQRPMKLR